MNDKQTLAIEVGKFYATRDGRKVKCLAKSTCDDDLVLQTVPDFKFPYGALLKSFNQGSCFWKSELFSCDLRDLDIVAEWVEPKRIKGWVNVNRHRPIGDEAIADLGGAVWPTRDLADSVAGERRIACIEIDVLEGHGLNGEGA